MKTKKIASLVCIILGILLGIAAIMNLASGSMLMTIAFILFAVFFFAVGMENAFNRSCSARRFGNKKLR